MKSLKKRVENGELVVTETDKSKRFCLLTREQYLESGKKHVQKDVEIQPHDLLQIQSNVNTHCEWLSQIFNVGANWEQSERAGNNFIDKSESVAPMYLLVKDHKGWSESHGCAPPSRPVCSGLRGFNKHLSELVSLILEPLSHASGGSDVNSTGSFLSKIDKLNKEREGNLLTEDDSVGRQFLESECICLTEDSKFSRDLKLKRVKRLRNLKSRGSVVPNLKSKLWASRLLEEVNGKRGINLPTGCSSCGNRELLL